VFVFLLFLVNRPFVPALLSVWFRRINHQKNLVSFSIGYAAALFSCQAIDLWQGFVPGSLSQVARHLLLRVPWCCRYSLVDLSGAVEPTCLRRQEQEEASVTQVVKFPVARYQLL